jgi:hypothetical protein
MRKLADVTGVPVAHPAVRPITTQEYEDVLDFALKDEVTAGNDEKVQPRPESLRHDHLRPLSELGKGKGH